MSNAESTVATTRYTVRRAKCLPGHILANAVVIIHHSEGGNFDISYLLPNPNTLSPGLGTKGLISPSLRNLSGSKTSGSG